MLRTSRRVAANEDQSDATTVGEAHEIDWSVAQGVQHFVEVVDGSGGCVLGEVGVAIKPDSARADRLNWKARPQERRGLSSVTVARTRERG